MSELSSKQILKALVPDIHTFPELKPSEFINKYWSMYKNSYPNNNGINGKVFEGLLGMVLVRAGVVPFYMQANVAFIPNVNYDIIIYTLDKGPIAISAKTSLRERYKQADLEAVALKYIHRKAKTFLVSLDKIPMKNLQARPDAAMGIDQFVIADEEEFDQLIELLKSYTTELAPTVEVVTSSVIITGTDYSALTE